ncbi:signal peptidase I [Clostridium sp. SHJSY1]|uniref:signal peptidase I n=1 Tax=Clostridium sp. SHJSY1 TaxID=2942483 RepID=UPI0028758539|nr:signal peptidase I [Clostridium sp. SHJSY1]MDS0526955.1 signal peptidase I [Clostridium sp. SHJSY1]
MGNIKNTYLDNKDSINRKLSINKNKKIKTYKNVFLEWIVPILISIVIALLIKKYLIFEVEVPTGSMIPTINENDKFLVTKIYNLDNMERGNIIVFYSNEFNELLIKRLIGLPGDDISIVDGRVSINGEELDESYVVNHDKFNGKFHVPEGKYFFLGDNRPDSNDSRMWKNPYVDGKDIKGKEFIRIYPVRDFGTIK